MLWLRKAGLVCIATLGIVAGGSASAQDKAIVLASPISTYHSGLFAHLLPLFTAKTGITVMVQPQETPQMLDAARRGEADVVFAHTKFSELRFVAEGFGVARLPVMYNDYVLIGPKTDPAGIKGNDDIASALRTIMNMQCSFVSRGDRSTTHLTELRLWNRDTGIDIEQQHGTWYKTTGVGMYATLEAAVATNSYVLSDRGTWLTNNNKGDLQILVEGDRRMFNQYAVMLVNPDRHPNVRKEFGQAFIDWLVSEEGQKAIADFKINGESMFYPNAHDPNA
jgi:tungstate transport system substrate-binding protein